DNGGKKRPPPLCPDGRHARRLRGPGAVCQRPKVLSYETVLSGDETRSLERDIDLIRALASAAVRGGEADQVCGPWLDAELGTVIREDKIWTEEREAIVLGKPVNNLSVRLLVRDRHDLRFGWRHNSDVVGVPPVRECPRDAGRERCCLIGVVVVFEL